MNLRGWIKLIYDKITLIYSVKNEFNPTSEVQNIGNGAFQNAPFANIPFANGITVAYKHSLFYVFLWSLECSCIFWNILEYFASFLEKSIFLASEDNLILHT